MSTTIALVVMSAAFLLCSKSFKHLSRDSWILFVSLLFYLVLHLFSFFFSSYKTYAMEDLIVKLPLLLLPTYFFFQNHLQKKHIQIALSVFTWTSLLFGSVLTARFLFIYFIEGQLHFSEALLDFTILHPTYLSMYLLLALSILVLERKNIHYLSNKYLYAMCMLILAVCIILLSSRTAIILGLLLSLGFLFSKLSKSKALIFSILIILLVSLSVWKTDYLNERFTKAINLATSNKTDPNSYEIDERAITWQNVITLIKERPIFGYTIGDYTHHYLKEKHNESGFGKGYREHLNAHNQFLESWLALGIVGLIALIGLYLLGIYFSYQHKLYYVLFFFLICFTFSQTESILQSQGGNMFFGLFLGLFLSNLKQKESGKE